MIRTFPVVVILLSLLLVACNNQPVSPTSAPTGLTVTAGDSQAVITWDYDPGLIYTLYYQVGADVDLGNYINEVTRITPPFIVTGLANQTQYAFILNASNQGSLPSPSTPIVTVTPSASGTGNSWTVGTSFTTRIMRSVAYGANNFVAVGDGGSVFIANANNTSSGISNWTKPAVALPISSGININSVVFNGSNFAIMAADGSTLTSFDTVTWTAATPVPVSGGVAMNWIAYGSGIYVAVGTGGTIATNATPDLSSTWTLQTSGTTQDLYGVSYVNGLFVATGKGGVLLTSSNGVNWTVQNSHATNDLYQVAYSGSTYVGIGNRGTVISSPDGVNWTLQSQPTPKNLYGIAYGVNAKFVIVGEGGLLLYSSDGSDGSWTLSGAGNVDLNAVVAANVFVAVGTGGANASGT